MTSHDIEVLDTIGTPDYLNGDLCIDGMMNAVTWLLSLMRAPNRHRHACPHEAPKP